MPFIDLGAGGVGVIHGERDVAVAGADLVLLHAPVVGEFQHRAVCFVLVADEGEGEFALGKIIAAQEAHAEHLGVEGQRFFEVADADHGVQDSHGAMLRFTGWAARWCAA
jgi:hypothetical protein